MRVYSAHKTAGRFAPKIINKKFRFVLKRGKCGSIFKTNLDIFIIFRETKAFFCEILLSLPLWERGLKYRRHLDTLASKHVILAANVLYLWQ